MLTELTSTNSLIQSLQVSIFSLRPAVLGHTTPENQRAQAPAESYVLLLPSTANHISRCHGSTYTVLEALSQEGSPGHFSKSCQVLMAASPLSPTIHYLPGQEGHLQVPSWPAELLVDILSDPVLSLDKGTLRIV